MNIDIRQSHIQKLSPKLEQSVRILQMDSQCLEQYITAVMLENPLIELEETSSVRENFTYTQDIYFGCRSKRCSSRDIHYGYDDPGSVIENIAPYYDGQNMVDHLISQAEYQFSGELRMLVQYLIGYINDNGYLSPSFDTICTQGRYPRHKLIRALKALQSLDPAGVGASTLGECLCLQLDPADELARMLIKNHMNDVAQMRTLRLSQILKCSQQDIEGAIFRIRALDPKPGRAFSSNDFPGYITPDVIITRTDPGFCATLASSVSPHIWPSKTYIDMMESMPDENIKEYISSKLEQLYWIKKCIESRDKTLLALANAIISYQERFFKFGLPEFLNVLRMKDLAADLHIHESTVSRAVSGKYLLCDHGVFSMKYFFVRSTRRDDLHVSNMDVKREVSALIATEDPFHPISDQSIAENLNSRGINISRRAVAKYRAEMGILNSSARALGH